MVLLESMVNDNIIQKEIKMDKIQLTTKVHAYFMAHAEDAPNWGGTPMVGGNTHQGLAENGYLTDLKKKGLVTTQVDREQGKPVVEWIYFTPIGKQYALENGYEIQE